MGNPTYDHFAYVKLGHAYDLAWLEERLRAMPGLTAETTLRRDMAANVFGMTKPRSAFKRLGLTRFFSTSPQAELQRKRVEFARKTYAEFTTQPALALENKGVALAIVYSNKPHVAEEAAELAASDGLDLARATSRFEFSGDDRDLVLLTAYTDIMNMLHATGHFVLYSGQTGLWQAA